MSAVRRMVSMRLDENLIAALKRAAEATGVQQYQTLIRQILWSWVKAHGFDRG